MKIFLDRDISKYKTLREGIMSTFGLGVHYAKKAFIAFGINHDLKMIDVSKTEMNILSKYYRKTYPNLIVNRELERLLYFATATLIETRAYRGIRINQGLPSRGQRTRSNAKTAKKLIGAWKTTTFAKRMLKRLAKKSSFNYNAL